MVHNLSTVEVLVQFDHPVLLHFEDTPKALANFSPGFERSETPGSLMQPIFQTLKGFDSIQTLTGFHAFFIRVVPGLSLRSNPGLKLANAFGVT